MISRLLKEAENVVSSTKYSDQHTFVSSFPTVRLLVAVQKDLLVRAAQSTHVSVSPQSIHKIILAILYNYASFY